MRIVAGVAIGMMAGASAFGIGGIKPMDMNGWTIVVADGAIPSEQYAAKEFQSLFQQATGIELPIASDPPDKKHNVFIGEGPAMAKSPVGFAVDALGDEGLRIRVKSANIAIAGGKPRGTLYGVYEFFERYMGARFLTCDDTYIPPRETLKPIPRKDFSFVPAFSFRWSFYKENADNPAFAARLRVNTVTHDEKLGGVTPQSLINHSLHKWVSPAEFGKTHPEYFALVDGERKLDVGGGGPELCVTNPEVIDIVAERVIKELDASPGQKNISVSQNDNDVYCRCPRCMEVIEREGTPMGPHLAFVNAVAERVEKKHPEVKIGTLAYWYTRKPPKTIVPRKNVQIQLCSIECCTLHAIDDPSCAKNREFCADMQKWKAICNDIWVWNYNTNFSSYDLPFPNLCGIGPNVRFFLKNNVKGVFMQANGNGNSGEMCDLRNYVISRCLWNPGQRSWPLVEEFCRLHYKNAAQPILDYLTMIHDNAQAKHCHPNCFPNAEQVGLDPEIAAKAIAYFDDAMAKADDDTVRARVEKASICAYKAMVVAGPGGWKVEDGACRRTWDDKYRNVVPRYIELCQKHHMTMASEGGTAAAYFEELQRQTGPAAVQIQNDVWRLTVVPGENGKLVEMFHKPTGRNLLAAMTHPDLLKGTHEEIGLQGYRHAKPLAFEAKVEGTTVVLTKTLEDGSTVERHILLKPDAPGTIFFESSITHKGAEPKTYKVKAHPEFDPATKSGDCAVLSAYIKDGTWTRVNRDWKMETGPDAAALTSAKGGAFAFYNHEAKFGVQVAYDPAQIDRPYLWWLPELQQINLELFTPGVELKNGESLSFSYRFDFLRDPPK